MRTFLLMLGSAFCGALLVVVGVYAYFSWQFTHAGPGKTVHFPARNEKTVEVAPAPVERERFYGTYATMSGEFSPSSRQTVLAAGPGKIAGSVTSGGKPLAGLRLRLALNGAVMSQWATTGADGRYEVALPYGKYRIDGYELDSSVVNTVLAGKTDGPRQDFHRGETLAVEEGKAGRGLDFAYVDPVRKLGPSGDVRLAQPVILSWQPYPGAAAYRLQLIEQKDPRDYESHNRVFEWRARPVVAGTSADMADHKVALKKGYYYTIEIEALDERNRAMSQSPRRYDKADFRVVE
jgi:hypothetical protein